MESSVIALIILAGTIVLFLTNWIPSAATAVLSCTLLVLFKVTSFSKAFSGFSNSTVILVFCLLTVGMAMENSGLAYSIGKLILRFASNERLFVVAGILLSAVLSMWLANTAVIVMFLAIVNSVVKTSSEMQLKHVCLPICMGAMFGGTCTLIGSTPQLTMQTIMESNAGMTYRIFDFMPVGLCLLATFILYYLFFGYPMGKKLWKADGDDVDENRIAELTHRSKMIAEGSAKDQIIVGCVLILMMVLFITEVLSTAMTALVVMFLLIILGQVKEKEIIAKMDWVVLIRLAGCLGIAAALDDCDAGQLVADVFIRIFGSSISESVLLLAMIILTVIISNFITNSTTVFIVLPPVLAIAQGLGMNPAPFGIACAYAANLTFATPLANAQTGITMVAGYKFGDYFKYNGLLEVIVVVIIWLMVPIFF